MELKDRERKIDVNSMSQEAVDDLGVQIGDKMREICEEAAAKANSILRIYGMNAKIAIAFDELPEAMAKSLKLQDKKEQAPSKTILRIDKLLKTLRIK